MAKILTIEEAAIKLHCSKKAVYKLIHKGDLPVLMIGQVYRINEDILDEYTKTHSKPIKPCQ